jgi:hypothetical protein
MCTNKYQLLNFFSYWQSWLLQDSYSKKGRLWQKRIFVAIPRTAVEEKDSSGKTKDSCGNTKESHVRKGSCGRKGHL